MGIAPKMQAFVTVLLTLQLMLANISHRGTENVTGNVAEDDFGEADLGEEQHDDKGYS